MNVEKVKSKAYPKENVLPKDVLCILCQPGQQYAVQQSISPYSVQMRENTDHKKFRIWALYTQWASYWFNLWYTCKFDRNVEDAGYRVLYYLQDGPDRAFSCEEMMYISEDIQVPP